MHMREIYIVTSGSDDYPDMNEPDRAFTTYEAADNYAHKTVKELYGNIIDKYDDGDNRLLISPRITEVGQKENRYGDEPSSIKGYEFTTTDKYERKSITTTYYSRIYRIPLHDGDATMGQ